MPWFKVDDNLAFHHKVVAAGNAAMGLWVRAGAMCAAQLTDGFVPDHMVQTLGGKAQAKRLVEVGLWHPSDGGYVFHEWGQRQPSKESVETNRAEAKQRMSELRAKRKKKKQERSTDVRANTEGTAGEVRSPRPDPTRPDPPSVSDGAAEPPDPTDITAQTLVAEWLDHCSQRPPSRVIGQTSKELKTLIADGIAPEAIRAGLATWARKGMHPSTLASIVHEHQAKTPTRPRADGSWTDAEGIVHRADGTIDESTLRPIVDNGLRMRPQ